MEKCYKKYKKRIGKDLHVERANIAGNSKVRRALCGSNGTRQCEKPTCNQYGSSSTRQCEILTYNTPFPVYAQHPTRCQECTISSHKSAKTHSNTHKISHNTNTTDTTKTQITQYCGYTTNVYTTTVTTQTTTTIQRQSHNTIRNTAGNNRTQKDKYRILSGPVPFKPLSNPKSTSWLLLDTVFRNVRVRRCTCNPRPPNQTIPRI